MANYVRRIVSYNTTRFKDHNLKLELNLVYVTDQVIIMGYPASGIEGLYRNHKRDAVKFLESRHGNNYWVYNFCPIKENSYDASIFGGRVSRYPFPDHHAPPLAILPLVTREIHAWLSGSSDRVAVLHCKAGKGRSGMMACAYLLSLDSPPVPPQLERSQTAKQWARRRTGDMGAQKESPGGVLSPISSPINAGISLDSNQLPVTQPELSPPFENQIHAVRSDTDLVHDKEGLPSQGSSTSPFMKALPVPASIPVKSFTNAVKDILDFHTARRMKALTKSTEDMEIKQAVSIPSQRRFLHYWALLLAHDAPKYMWDTQPSSSQSQGLNQSTSTRPRVHLTQITVRLREMSKIKLGIVKAASVIIGKKKRSVEYDQLWVSISKYDDDLIDGLEKWDVYTRDPQGNMGKRHFGPEYLSLDVRGEDVTRIFENGKWDKGKMLQSFAHFGVDKEEDSKVLKDTDGKIYMCILRPMSDKRPASPQHGLHSNVDVSRVIRSESESTADTRVKCVPKDKDKDVSAVDEKGVLLDAGREVRVKLYMGQVPLGWVYFIPTFHMQQPPPSSSNGSQKSHLLFTRNEIDFPLGTSGSIMDIEMDVEMEWVIPDS